MKYDKQDEELAKKEYLSMIDTFSNLEEFSHEWKGHWDDVEKESFTGRMVTIKGDRDKYMKHYLETKEVIENMDSWDRLDEEMEDYYSVD